MTKIFDLCPECWQVCDIVTQGWGQEPEKSERRDWRLASYWSLSASSVIGYYHSNTHSPSHSTGNRSMTGSLEAVIQASDNGPMRLLNPDWMGYSLSHAFRQFNTNSGIDYSVSPVWACMPVYNNNNIIHRYGTQRWHHYNREFYFPVMGYIKKDHWSLA